jgi:hypothetical protein
VTGLVYVTTDDCHFCQFVSITNDDASTLAQAAHSTSTSSTASRVRFASGDASEAQAKAEELLDAVQRFAKTR